MAIRPIFVPNINGDQLYEEINVEFKWSPGFAIIQKQKNIKALHEKAREKELTSILEVSSKSSEILGQRLSAFSLKIDTLDYGDISIECAFQGSKVFEKNIQYTDIYSKKSIEAKKDHRIRNSGKLIGFNFMGDEWELEPKSAFYDWIYIKALYPHKDFLKKLYQYQGFTDIEFNPNKSINCQARTCAIIISLLKRDLYDEAMTSKKRFIEIIYKQQFKQGLLL
jgi:hypothetical protein